MSAAGTKTANAVGGKTARACDSCVRKRARWYCAADDAFLCHSCDGSVHSANQLAGRHERVLLENASSDKLFGSSTEPSTEPTWHQRLIRKARTPRRQRTKSSSVFKSDGRNVDATNSSVHRLVPEMGDLEASLLEDNDDEEELLYRVPVFDPFEAELCNASNELAHERSLSFETCTNLDDLQLAGFDHLQTTDDLEFMEFAADVESLLGKGFDDTKTSCRINIDDDLGLSTINNNYDYNLEEYDNNNDNTNSIIGTICFDENRVKVEDKEEAILGFDDHLDAISRETVLLNCDDHFDYDHESPMMMMMIKEEEEEKKVKNEEHMMMKSFSIISLRLNYEDVINTWADQGSPWTNGTRPKLNSDGSWPDSMEWWSSQWLMGSNYNINASYGGGGGGSGSDGGREARVSRYREKRRRRLFSKKIRYEVRKLNAEKRPRMKGRFVKRGSSC